MLNSSDYQKERQNQNSSEIPSLPVTTAIHKHLWTTKAGVGMGNWVLTVAGHVNWYRQYREHCAGSRGNYKQRQHAATIPLLGTSAQTPRCRRYRHPACFQHCLQVTDVEATYFSISRIRGKEGLIRMPNGTVLSRRKEWNNATGSLWEWPWRLSL